MSHFTVLVVGNNIEEQLAPFQENNMETCPEEYLEFFDLTEEIERGWEEKTLTGYFKNNKFFHDPVENNKNSTKFSVKDIYENLDKFAEDYYGYKKIGDRYGYWENPNAKWDWYLIGGRWTGFFKLKKGKSGKIGSPGIVTPIAQEGYADQAKKKDIDFEDMMLDAFIEAKEEYELVIEKTLGGSLGGYKPWSYFKNRKDGSSAEMARKLYWGQEQLKIVRNKIEELGESIPFSIFNGLDDFYNKTKEEYAKEQAENSISTFAVLKDSVWYEKGEMGWFGIAVNEKEREEWNGKFLSLLNNVSEDTLLTIVDCHI